MNQIIEDKFMTYNQTLKNQNIFSKITHFLFFLKKNLKAIFQIF